jgi:thiol-disulfide isomerase/thioredoxin
MSTKFSLALFSLCVALALSAGGAQARFGEGGQKAKGKKNEKAAAKNVADRPQVCEIDEAGLKAILDESAKTERRLVINFWATWCVPCRKEFPDLVKIDEEFRGPNDFEFITVSLDDISEIEKGVPEFLAEMRAQKMPAYLLNAKDPEAVIALVDKTWRGELPATFLFGRKGEMLFRHTGPVKAEELRAAINASTAAPAASDDK